MKLLDPDKLREALDQNGLSYADVGRSAGVSKGFISHLTAGRKKTCTPLVAYRIAAACNVPLSFLFEVELPTSTGQDVNQNRKAA